jgi:hypothetical protein
LVADGWFVLREKYCWLVADKPSEQVAQSRAWRNGRTYTTLELDNGSTMEKVKHILLLSYSELPYHLKTCFLYFSIYPEDYKIRRKNVVQRWVAEGFISEKRGLSAEQVAENYFAEFVNRSMIQPIDISDSEKVKTCRIHDVMLEVIVRMSVEQNFISLWGNQYVMTSHDKVRRLSLHMAMVRICQRAWNCHMSDH